LTFNHYYIKYLSIEKKLLGLPVDDPIRDFVLKTLENDSKERPSSSELITRLNKLTEESEKKTIIVSKFV